MGRPLNSNSELAALNKQDTMYWCGLIKIFSGLSDSEIEHRISNLSGLNSRQIKTRLDSVSRPSGRNFNRWLNGKRSMDQDAIQIFVKKARDIGLLPKQKSLRSHYEAAIEARAMSNNPERAKSNLQNVLKVLKELQNAKMELDKAADKFQNSAIKAKTMANIIIYDDESLADETGEFVPTAPELNLELISRRIKSISNKYLLDGYEHKMLG